MLFVLSCWFGEPVAHRYRTPFYFLCIKKLLLNERAFVSCIFWHCNSNNLGHVRRLLSQPAVSANVTTGSEDKQQDQMTQTYFIFPLINTIQCPFCKCKAISHMKTDYQEANAVFLHHVHSRRNYEAVTLIQACVITISQFFFSQPNDLRTWDRWRNKFGLIWEYFKQKLWINIRSWDDSLFWA